jgi:GNAT superfamily N-acetyltransferase
MIKKRDIIIKLSINIKSDLSSILQHCLYVKGWCAKGFFQDFVVGPKDYQRIDRLAVAYLDGRPVGWAALLNCSSDVDIDEVWSYVHEDCRRKGIGSALVKELGPIDRNIQVDLSHNYQMEFWGQVEGLQFENPYKKQS